MSTEENKALSRQVRETMDAGELAAFDDYVAPDAVFHIAGNPAPLGREEMRGLLEVFYSAFPDLQHTFEDQIAEGDKVVTRITFRGTHRGEFQGIPPTGNEVAFPALDIDRFEDGKIVEHWANLDNLGLMQQLGVIPPPEQSEEA